MDASVLVVSGVKMPRALIISTEDSNLQPIKTLFDKNKVVYGEIDLSKKVTDTDKPLLSEVLKNTNEKYDCVFISCTEWQQLPQDIGDIHCFIFYSLPETYLLSEIKKQKAAPQAQVIPKWKQHISSCLKLIEQSHPATLISLDDVLTNADAFLKEIFGKEKSRAEETEVDISSQLLELGIKASLVDRDDLYELYDELLSHSRLFGNFRVHLSPDIQVFKNEAHSLIEIAKAFNEKSTKVAELKSQLDELSINSNNLSKELSEQLQIAESALEEKEVLALEIVRLKEKTAEEIKRAELHVFQLQEELEETFTDLQKTKTSQEQQNKEASAKEAKLQAELLKNKNDCSSKLTQIESEKEKLLKEFKSAEQDSAEKLNEAQRIILKLREELEASFLELKETKTSQEKQEREAVKKVAELQSDLAKKTKDWTSKVKQLESEKDKLSKEVKKFEQQSKEELKQAELQVFQVQEELEVTFLELESIKNKISSLTDGKSLDTFVSAIKNEKLLLEEQISFLEKDLAQQQSEQSELEVNGVKEELEVATLQITQLQEELEFYYLQAVEHSKLKGTEMQKSIIANAFDSILAEQAKIVGQYEADDYRDLHMILENINFPHCGNVDTLSVKLINVSGKLGVEFRTEGNPDNLFTIYDDCSDEYGPYLRYFPDAPEFLNEQQEKTKHRLNANERLLSFCTLNCIQKVLIEGLFTNDAAVDESIVKDWKLSLADLDFRKYYSIDWLSFDSVTIKECFAMDGYEHLWLQFSNILAGDVLRRNLDIKVCAKNLTENGDDFLASFFLEFRVNSDGTEPLYAWPPETSDEYGPRLEVGLQEDLASLTLAKEDERLISLIRDNIQSILVKCDTTGATLKHPVNAWCNAVQNSLDVNNEEDVTDGGVESKDEGFNLANELLPVEEVVDLDSYQHIVFSSEQSQLKIKLRADNINKDTFDAEVYLEFRDGTQNVIYSDTEFFDVDDYGPRVKIPAEILEPLSSNTEYSGDFERAAACYAALTPSIEGSDRVDDLLKIMWLKLLERKKQD